MKQIILSVIVALSTTTLSAQTVNVHFKNGQTIQFNSSNVDYVDFSSKAPDPTVTSGTAVDLGLSVYWASCNLGAEKPEEYGDYYAWGETKPKSKYNESTYSYYNSSLDQFIDIGKDISGTEYDAATVNLGSDWRMPTKDEMSELVSKCIWEWTQINGINGYKVTGPNGNTIFMPASGFNQNGLYDVNKEYYYSTSTSSSKSEEWVGCDNGDTHTRIIIIDWPKQSGVSIRPVTSNPNAGGSPVDHSQDYLVTDKISASFTGGAYSSINGRISSGGQLSWRFSNGSDKSVTLTGIQLINGATGVEGNNMLSAELEVAAGESKAYTVTVGVAGIQQPKIRFTYRYNKKSYSVEAVMPESF